MSAPFRDLMGLGPSAAWPYGVFICASGREVMFNRRYKPMWQRDSAEAPARPADPAEWVAGIVEQHWYYSAATAFEDRPALFRPELEAWGLPA